MWVIVENEKNYRTCRRVYQTLFYEIAETFVQYINTLTADEIEQLDADLRSNDWGVKSIVQIEDCIELLRLFQLFHYLNVMLSVNKWSIANSGRKNTRRFWKNVSKTLYEMFKDTKSHGLASIQFLSALNLFFWPPKQTMKT